MSNNTNLFYNLYSTTNAVLNAGYKCTSAIDESTTSFDITSSTTGSAGTITDSNGNTLGSIGLSDVHAEGITQYNVETRVLQPYSCCLLQGLEYGLACASYYFLIPKQLKETENYEEYVSCDFDVIYNNFTPYKFHISTEVGNNISFVDKVNDLLDKYNIEIVASIQEMEDPEDGLTYEYLVFLSLKAGYFYYINNLKLSPAFQSVEYPDSPFSQAVSGMKSVIYEFIELEKIVKDDYCPCGADCSCGPDYCEPTDDEYEVPCDIYRWLIANFEACIENLDNFGKAIKLYNLYYETGNEEYLDQANELIKNTPYDDAFLNEYSLSLDKIYNIVKNIKDYVQETKDYYQEVYWLIEDRHRRIPLMKYPNGAFRGIAIVPDWPTNDSQEDNDKKSLWINHIKNEVKLYRPTKEHLFLPKIYGVLSNATLMAEEDCYKKHDHHFKGIQSNMSMQHNIPDGWMDNLDTDYVDPYRPEHSIYEDTMYMGQNCYACKKNVIGLFRSMQYVNDNRLWNKFGLIYMIIGNEDDPQSKDKNLPQSLLIYNPNPEPIRIKYMIFS